jgi:nucleotide-binding universal stress UspA family protein
MFRTVLVPLDGSPLAEQALPLALGLARRAGGAVRLALVHLEDFRGPQADVEAIHTEQAYLDTTAARLRQPGGPSVTAELIKVAPVAMALAEYAQAVKADLITLTTHGHGPLSRFWLGSVADELLRRATVPLLVHRPAEGASPGPGAEPHFRRILVPLDGSELSEAALKPAAELARLYGAGLLLLRAVVPVAEPDGVSYLTLAAGEPLLDALTTQARADLDRVAKRLRAEGLPVDARVVVNASAAVAVLEAAPVADLIVLATHGRGRVARFFLGSVADKVVRAAPRPVLVVPSRPNPGGLS